MTEAERQRHVELLFHVDRWLAGLIGVSCLLLLFPRWLEAHGNNTAAYEHYQECQINGTYGNAGKPEGGHFHHAVISKLKPATVYHFVLESDGELSRPLHFITSPDKGTDFSIIHGGDSRSGHLARCQMNQMIADMVKQVFNIAPDAPDWHTTMLGKDVAMVTLDTNVPGGGADLLNEGAKFEHPRYSTGNLPNTKPLQTTSDKLGLAH